MCLMKVREEADYSVPARRVVSTRRVVRQSPSPPRARIIRESIREERKQSYIPPPPPPPQPEPEPLPPPPPPAMSLPPPSPRASTTIRSERRTSRTPSRAPSARTRTETHFVEVDQESDSSDSSSDVRSRTTSHTRKSARSKTTAPQSEYSVHEREYRRERGYSSPKPDYETYRYVEAPKERRSVSRNARGSQFGGPAASRDSFQRETRIRIEDGSGRRDVEYRR